MAADHHCDCGRVRLAHMEQPVGAGSNDPLLRGVYTRHAEGSPRLADEPPLHDRSLFRSVPGVLAHRIRDPQGLLLRQRRGGDSTLDLYAFRTSGLSGFPCLGNTVHRVLRLAVLGSLCLGVSACAQWTPGWLEKPKIVTPTPVPSVTYEAQPRLGGNWQYQQPQRGLVHILGKRMPAIVNKPEPGPYVPRLSLIHQETMPYPYAQKKPFRIPESWFRGGAKHATANVQQAKTPWKCQPAKLPCGKQNTDYWACTKSKANQIGEGKCKQ